MAVEVSIKSKELIKKKLTIKDILLENQSFGIMDEAFRLDEGKEGEITVIYNTDNICRGYEATLRKGQVDLRLPLPNSEYDINSFYKNIIKICKLMKTKYFIREGEKVSINDVDKYIEIDKDTSLSALEMIDENIKNDAYENFCIFGAINPISIGEREIEIIHKDLNKFTKFMHDTQFMDIYYAKPSVYERHDKSLFGMYVITENCKSVLPIKPSIMNNNLKIDDWNVGFVINQEVAGTISYDDFLSNVSKEELYDSNHFILTMNENEINDLLKKYKIDL